MTELPTGVRRALLHRVLEYMCVYYKTPEVGRAEATALIACGITQVTVFGSEKKTFILATKDKRS